MTTASHKQAASKHPAKHSESKQSRGGHAEGKHAEGKDLESKLAETDPIELKLARVQQQVQDLFATHPDWIKFYRDVIGCEGLIRRIFPNHEAMAEFDHTEIYHDIHRMMTELRKRPLPKEANEKTKVITVRIPASLHELLRTEACEHHTTMNKLCISKLVQFVDSEHVPMAFGEKASDDEDTHESPAKKETEVDL